MLNFKRFTLLFFILLLGLNLYYISGFGEADDFLNSHKLLTYSLLLFIYFGISFLLSFFPCSGFHHKVICKGTIEKNWISLTFDDGPDPAFTGNVLGVLKKHGVTATFFITGLKTEKHPELVKAIDREGHTIGNHSYSHSGWFDLFPTRRMINELRRTNDLIHLHTGKTPQYFRPPYGVMNPMLSRAVKSLELITVCWSLRSFDTVSVDSVNIMKKLMRKLEPGSVILLHDRSVFVQNHLDVLIRNIAEQGYEIKPLHELLHQPAYV